MTTFPFDQGFIALSRSSGRLLAYNPTALRVWRAMEQGRTPAELANSLADEFGIPIEAVRQDINHILNHWQSEGLIRQDSDEAPAVPETTAAKAEAKPPEPEPPGWAAIWRCRIGQHTIEFAVQRESDVAPMRPLFQHLEVKDAEADSRIEIKRAGRGEAALIENGVERLRTNLLAELIGALHQSVLEQIRPGIEWRALIHGGAVALNGAGIALPAPSGSGKTTLVAYLAANGFAYLADDLTAVSAPEGRIVPWPMPLSLKPGSWEVLSGSYPELAQARLYRTKGLDARLLVLDPSAWEAEPVPLRALVFPQFRSSASARLDRLEPFQALERLLADRIWLGYPLDEQRVRHFLTWLEDIPAFAMCYGDLSEAESCVRSVLAG